MSYEPTFSSSKDLSMIEVEKRKGDAPTASWIKENSLGAYNDITPRKADGKGEATQSTSTTVTGLNDLKEMQPTVALERYKFILV
jgi:hypothetical protein